MAQNREEAPLWASKAEAVYAAQTDVLKLSLYTALVGISMALQASGVI